MKHKTILLGITGGIAAIKIPSLIKLLKKDSFKVIPVMTRSAGRIINQQKIERTAEHQVYTDLFAKNFNVKKVLDTRLVDHIEIADQADLVVIAPATANILAKLAHGIADDFLSTTLLATTCPVLLCPSMNVHMWNNPIVRNNIQILKNYGYFILEPESGMLACGYEGSGKLSEVTTIFAEIKTLLNRTEELKGKTILVTAGGTIEPIDDVRFITNKSSGKMGVALADACARRGASVILLKSERAVAPQMPMTIFEFETATELESLLHQMIKQCDICFHAAAVSDFTVSFVSGKRPGGQLLSLDLIPREKIYQNLKKMNPQLSLFLFKAEYKKADDVLIEKSRNIINDMNVDGVIVNDIGKPDRGFEVDTNEVIIVLSEGSTHYVPLATKREIAEKIIDIALLKGKYASNIS